MLLRLQRRLPCFCFEFVQSEWHGHFHSFPRGGSGTNVPCPYHSPSKNKFFIQCEWKCQVSVGTLWGAKDNRSDKYLAAWECYFYHCKGSMSSVPEKQKLLILRQTGCWHTELWPFGAGSESAPAAEHWGWAPCLQADRGGTAQQGTRAGAALSKSIKNGPEWPQPAQCSFSSPPSQGETPLGLYKDCVVIVNHHSLLAKGQFLLSPLYVSLCSSGPKKLVGHYLALKYFQSKLKKKVGEGGFFLILFFLLYSYEKDVLLPICGSSLFSLEF